MSEVWDIAGHQVVMFLAFACVGILLGGLTLLDRRGK